MDGEKWNATYEALEAAREQDRYDEDVSTCTVIEELEKRGWRFEPGGGRSR